MLVYSKRRVLGYTLVGWLNILVLQWFWVRLAGHTEHRPDGIYEGWCLLYGCAPVTGWFSDYWPPPKTTGVRFLVRVYGPFVSPRGLPDNSPREDTDNG